MQVLLHFYEEVAASTHLNITSVKVVLYSFVQQLVEAALLSFLTSVYLNCFC